VNKAVKGKKAVEPATKRVRESGSLAKVIVYGTLEPGK
jgi:hypothetical protein